MRKEGKAVATAEGAEKKDVRRANEDETEHRKPIAIRIWKAKHHKESVDLFLYFLAFEKW